MQIKASELAILLNGSVEGDPEICVNSLAKIEEGTPHSLSFLSNPAYSQYLYSTGSSVVIVSNSYVLEKPLKKGCTLIRVKDPRQSFALLLEQYSKVKPEKKGIDPKASIDPTAKLGENVYVGPSATVGQNSIIGKNVKIHPNTFVGENVEIGDGCILHPGVRICDDSKIGKSCVFQSGVVIGGDGFGFQPNTENNYNKIPQVGNVVIEDFVEIGANTTVDRATLGSTIIRRGVKLDNLIQIGHNVEIGENTVMASQVGVSGSTTIGRNCVIGGQVGIVGHIKIADGVKIAAQSGVGNDVKEPGTVLQGSPAYAIGDYKRSYVLFRKLPELIRQIAELEKKLNELKQLAAENKE